MNITRKTTTSLILLFLICHGALPNVRLSRLISNGMVLQREIPIRIWGWANAGEEVNVAFKNKSYTSVAGNDGKWELTIAPQKAGGPFEMTISAGNHIKIKDILIGDVWVCSGQSQMDMNMKRVSPLYEEELKNAGNDRIRYFSVPTVYNFNEPQFDLPSGKWEHISQENILDISAIAYFFAKELYDKYSIPLGIIHSSVGGSPAEAWISEDGIIKFPQHYAEAIKFKDSALINQIQKSDQKRIEAWFNKLNNTDKGFENLSWYNPDLDISCWPEIYVPGYWTEGNLKGINGVVWFRKDIEIPANLAGKSAKLNLGRIVDADSVFVNGQFIGSVGYQYPPRRYEIPENVLNEGSNTIVVRLISQRGTGGFVPDKPYELIIDGNKINLEGIWHYRIGNVMEPLAQQTFIRWKPTGLFNGMITPLTHFSIKGVIWYQGESNTYRPEEYAELFPVLIKNWRGKWQQGNFPFIYVQLHNYGECLDQPTESNWALTREAQLKTLSLPNTAMVVAIDLGEWNDIHPLNKKDVAKRLALAALKTAYHEKNIVASGPIYRSMKVKGDKIEISFSHTGSGLMIKDGDELKQFAIAGKNRKFIWAKAIIKGNKVIVWDEDITDPIAVRYAWADNPEGSNLYNKEGLPASPFRTDHW